MGIRKMPMPIIKLSALLRTALDSDSADLISLQDELKFVREYLDLEKMRFSRRLQIEWLVAPATKWAVGTADDPSTVNRERNPAWRFLCREGGWVAVAANPKDGILENQVRNSVAGRVQA
jgi:Histidine kinase